MKTIGPHALFVHTWFGPSALHKACFMIILIIVNALIDR